jgi:hypothetical protein
MCEPFSSNISNFVSNISNYLYQRKADKPSPSVNQRTSSYNHDMHTTLTVLPFRAGNISSALCSSIFGDCKTSWDFNTSLLFIVVPGVRWENALQKWWYTSTTLKYIPKRKHECKLVSRTHARTHTHTQRYTNECIYKFFLKHTATFTVHLNISTAPSVTLTLTDNIISL